MTKPIVVGVDGSESAQRAVRWAGPGSTSQALLHHSPCPVAVVRQD